MSAALTREQRVRPAQPYRLFEMAAEALALQLVVGKGQPVGKVSALARAIVPPEWRSAVVAVVEDVAARHAEMQTWPVVDLVLPGLVERRAAEAGVNTAVIGGSVFAVIDEVIYKARIP